MSRREITALVVPRLAVRALHQFWDLADGQLTAPTWGWFRGEFNKSVEGLIWAQGGASVRAQVHEALR